MPHDSFLNKETDVDKKRFDPLGNGSYRKIASGKVLVADDNRDIAETTSMIIQLWGHDVRMAFDGEDAYRQVLQWRPDVVLLDIAMPRMNGLEVARAIRKKGFLEMRLIALTSHGYGAVKRMADEAGFDIVLTKPSSQEALRAAIERGIYSER